MVKTTTTKRRGRPKKKVAEKEKIVTREIFDDYIEEEKVEKPTVDENEKQESDYNVQAENNNDMSDSSILKEFDIDDAEIITEEYSPIDDDVITRGYEGGGSAMPKNAEDGIDIPQPALTFDSDIPVTPTEPTPNLGSSDNTPSAQGGSSSNHQQHKEEKSYFSNDHSSHAETSTETPAEKRRNATKMADTLLMVYRENFPTLFKYIAKFNEGKISRMELNGELDRSMPILEDGTTVGQYIAQVNKSADEMYVITDEQLAEVREPLIDWLMEKDLKLTPAQRLAIALGGHAISFGLASLQQFQQNRHAMNQFAEFHADWRNGGSSRRNNTQDIPRASREQTRQEYEPTEEVRTSKNTMENISDLDNTNMMPQEEDNYSVETIPNNEESEEINLDDYMNDDSPSNEDIPD